MIKIIKFKIDVMEELKNKNITYYTIKENKVFSAGTLKKIKEGDMSLSLNSINKICNILNKDVADILVHTKDK